MIRCRGFAKRLYSTRSCHLGRPNRMSGSRPLRPADSGPNLVRYVVLSGRGGRLASGRPAWPTWAVDRVVMTLPLPATGSQFTTDRRCPNPLTLIEAALDFLAVEAIDAGPMRSCNGTGNRRCMTFNTQLPSCHPPKRRQASVSPAHPSVNWGDWTCQLRHRCRRDCDWSFERPSASVAYLPYVAPRPIAC